MAKGSKQAYTDKQKRQAEHIEEGYEKRGLGQEEAERRAWATVNKISGGGKKSGSGRGKKANPAPSKTGGKRGGARAGSSTKRAAARRASPRRTPSRAGNGKQGN